MVFNDSEQGISLLQSSLKQKNQRNVMKSLEELLQRESLWKDDKSLTHKQDLIFLSSLLFFTCWEHSCQRHPTGGWYSRGEGSWKCFAGPLLPQYGGPTIQTVNWHTYQKNCNKKTLRWMRNHLSKLKIMADNVLVRDNGVGEREDGHLSLTLPTPDLNLDQRLLI